MYGPPIRRSFFVMPELLKGYGDSPEVKHHKDSFADGQAKQMMGAANPLTGADSRPAASTFCQTCSRWHRPGVACSNKSFEDATLSKGRRIAVFHPATGAGNSFHHPGTGAFVQAPQSGGALAEHHLAKLGHVVERHNSENPESAAPSELTPADSSQSGMYQPAPMEYAAPHQDMSPPTHTPPSASPQPRPMDLPSAVHGVHTLLTYKPEPREHVEPGKKLEQNSAHIQGTQQNYLSALRAWQAMHTAT